MQPVVAVMKITSCGGDVDELRAESAGLIKRETLTTDADVCLMLNVWQDCW